MSNPFKGYLYIAYGEDHIKEAIISVSTLRAVDSTAHVTLVADREVEGFDKVVVKDIIRNGFEGKAQCLSNEYYTNTFFLDADTHVCEDPSALFDLLSYFDLCAVLDPAEIDTYMPGLTPYNSGVMLFGSRTEELFSTFRRYYQNEDILQAAIKGHPAGVRRMKPDQPPLMLAIRDTKIRVHSLPSIWNARYRFNISLMGKVKIIHGPATDFEALEAAMNKGRVNRCWEAKNWNIKYGVVTS